MITALIVPAMMSTDDGGGVHSHGTNVATFEASASAIELWAWASPDVGVRRVRSVCIAGRGGRVPDVVGGVDRDTPRGDNTDDLAGYRRAGLAVAVLVGGAPVISFLDVGGGYLRRAERRQPQTCPD